MKYMVMECQFSYAVVLDEDGNFLKVANRHYHVGQMVTDIIEMQTPDIQGQPVKKRKYKWLYSAAAVAACLILVAAPLLRMWQLPYASVYMAINPEMRIDVNRKDVVVGLEGVNADGDNLIGNYSYKRKPLNLVMDELVDRAIETGFLHEGGQITLVLDAEDGKWVKDREASIRTHLDEYLRGKKMSVTIEVRDKASQDAASQDTEPQRYEVVIPIVPANTGKEPVSPPSVSNTQPDHQVPDDDGQSGYDDQNQDYNQSNYDSQSNDDGQSNYDSQSNDDGQSNYDSQSNDDGQSNYSSQSDYDD